VLLIYLSVAWMAGIYVSSHLDVPLTLWGLVSLLPLSVAVLWRRHPHVRLAALCGFFVLLGALRYRGALPRLDDNHIAAYNDRGPVVLVGVVVAEPDVRGTYTNLRLRAETLALEGEGSVDVEGVVLVRTPRYPEHLYGDRLRVRGELETPPVFDSFSYRDYLARQGIHSTVRWARITSLGRDQANWFYGRLLGLKQRAQSVIADVVPEPSASLLSGILLGIEGQIPSDLFAAFQATGTAHIIAISGFNMALVGGLFASLSVRLVGRRYAAWFATGAIALYTLFVGAAAAVVRAAVMSVVAVWGRHFGRQNSAPNALFATALVMTAWNPHTLWDLGFLLSFAATLGLIVFADPFQRGFEGLLARLMSVRWAEPAAKYLHEPLVLSTCSQLTTMPIILYSFGTLSIVTLLSNALILPLQTQVMLWGTAATVGGMVWLPLGRALGWVAWLFLAGTIWGVETTARLPNVAVDLGAVSPSLVWGWYGFLAVGAWLLVQTEERRRETWRALLRGPSGWFSERVPLKMVLGGLAIVATLVWLAVSALPDGKLHVTFWDVDEGDAVFIRAPLGQHVLISSAASPEIAAHVGRQMPFWDRTLELIVLTSGTSRQWTGLIPVLERYQGEHMLYASRACTGHACDRGQALVREQGTITLQPVRGTDADLGMGVVLSILHPRGDHSSAQDDPVVVRVDYGQTCFLIVGGAGQRVQETMLARGENVRCDVLHVRSRGDEPGTSPGFRDAVRPALVVLSGEDDDPMGSTARADRERLNFSGVTVLPIGEYGSIEIISDGTGYHVRVRQ
jgi:competence protein ComEC